MPALASAGSLDVVLAGAAARAVCNRDVPVYFRLRAGFLGEAHATRFQGSPGSVTLAPLPFWAVVSHPAKVAAHGMAKRCVM